MGQLAKTLATHDRTEGAAAALERAAYALAREVFAGRLYEIAERKANQACLRYVQAVAHATGTDGGAVLSIIPDEEAMTVTVIDEDAYGKPIARLIITPDTIQER